MHRDDTPWTIGRLATGRWTDPSASTAVQSRRRRCDCYSVLLALFTVLFGSGSEGVVSVLANEQWVRVSPINPTMLLLPRTPRAAGVRSLVYVPSIL